MPTWARHVTQRTEVTQEANGVTPIELSLIVSVWTKYFQKKPQIHLLYDIYIFCMKQVRGPHKVHLQSGVASYKPSL